jgi:hypothetical protein
MMMRLFKFDSLITPSIAKFLFYIGVAIWTLIGLGTMAGAMRYSVIGGILGGSLLVLVGIVVSRVLTEMTLVIFMIRDELAWQREQRQRSVAE